MIAVLLLAACKSVATSPGIQPDPSETPTAMTPVTATLSTATALHSKDAKSVTPSATQTPSPPTPTTQPATPVPQVITRDNAASLRLAHQIQFSPWELVLAIAWSPDGDTLAVMAGETIHLYEVGTFEERLALPAGVWSPGLAFGPDSRLLASGGRDGTVQLWDAVSGEAIYSIPAHKKGTNAVTFSPNGELLASAGNDGMVRLWDTDSAELQGELIGGAYAIPALVFTSDGLDLAIANAGVIRFRQVESGRFTQTLSGESSFYSLAIAPDGQTLASGDNQNTLWLWNLPGGDLRFKLAGPTGQGSGAAALVWDVAYSPDGRLLASAGGDKTIRVWDVGSGELLATFTEHKAAVTSLTFSPDGLWLATGGLDAKIMLWHTEH
jgi:WD40 repeat protein